MQRRTAILLQGAMILAAAGISAYFFPSFPEHVATHWNAAGEENGAMPKAFGLFFAPAFMLFFAALFSVLPKIDPLKRNVEAFRGAYDSLASGVIFFIFYVHILSILWNAGIYFNMTSAVSVPLAGLWYFIGTLMPEMKPNWFMGIRTPWTLADERVWKETHDFGGKSFKAGALVSLVGAIPGGMFFLFAVAALVLSSLVPVVYSYISFAKKQ